MWKLLSKASIAAAATALAITTMSAPATAQDAPTNPSEALDKVTSLLPTQPAGESQAPSTKQGTPVPLPRPIPEGNQTDNAEKANDKSLDVVALPKELVDKLPESGVVPPSLAKEVRGVLGDRLDGIGSVELPKRRLTTDPNGNLVILDPENVQPDGVVSSDRPVTAQQEGGGAPAANLGAILQKLLQQDGPLAGLQGLNGGLG